MCWRAIMQALACNHAGVGMRFIPAPFCFPSDDGISIPQNYTSFLHPVQSPKLYNDVRNCREKDKPAVTPFEMPYVVYLQNVLRVGEPQPLFHFRHPNRGQFWSRQGQI